MGEHMEWYDMNVIAMPIAVASAIFIVGRNLEGCESAVEMTGDDSHPGNLVSTPFFGFTLHATFFTSTITFY